MSGNNQDKPRGASVETRTWETRPYKPTFYLHDSPRLPPGDAGIDTEQFGIIKTTMIADTRSSRSDESIAADNSFSSFSTSR